MAAISQATILRTRCQRKSSTWSKKFISNFFGSALPLMRLKNCLRSEIVADKMLGYGSCER